MPSNDLLGQKFNRLTVVSFSHTRNGDAFWVCICDCGTEKIARAKSLKTGDCKSCGCLKREHDAARSQVMTQRNYRHGMGRTPECKAYYQAHQRCTNPNCKAWKDYGGRGIKFMFESFEQFYSELGDKPEPKRLYSVDRIDNDGNYESGNVRWATRSQQNSNQRRYQNTQ